MTTPFSYLFLISLIILIFPQWSLMTTPSHLIGNLRRHHCLLSLVKSEDSIINLLLKNFPHFRWSLPCLPKAGPTRIAKEFFLIGHV